VQAGRPALQQTLAKPGHHVQAKSPDGCAIVSIAFKPAPDPLWNLGAADSGEAG